MDVFNVSQLLHSVLFRASHITSNLSLLAFKVELRAIFFNF